ncbi:MAG: NUDIX domain-containing protein [Candidatus Nanohaloarchaea archaeon]
MGDLSPGKDHVGVSTPFYCVNKKGEILFQLRGEKTRDESGRWDPGSGELEKGLTLKENVKKEVKEELNAECEIIDRLPSHGIFREHEGRETHWVVAPFFVKVDPGDVEINEPEKIEKLKWASLGGFPQPLHTGFRETFERYREEFEEVVEEVKHR